MSGRAPQVMSVAPAWIEAHCIVPDGFRKGRPFRPYDHQLRYLGNFYLVRGEAEWIPEAPLTASAFVYRRAMLVGPQKLGKNPLIATQVCLEGVGPSLFGGWAGPDDGYACADWGCRCGWEYAYEPSEPMGMPRPTPLIEITAFSEDSTDNTYSALRPMIDEGPLHDLIRTTGEDFIRLPDLYGRGFDAKNTCRINTVTSSPGSRLGGRVTFAPQDEVGIWTAQTKMVHLADTQYRNLAGMGGRASLTTNAWDPAQQSVAQREFESAATDVYRQFIRPPANLSYTDKRERHRIHLAVYPPDTRRENGGHVELEAIEAEAADLVAKDPPQAARFFGNMLVAGSGKAFDAVRWAALAKPEVVIAPRSIVTLGFDGSYFRDATGLIATEVVTGHQWPLGLWERPADLPASVDWEVPRDQVEATVELAFDTFRVFRLYGDPPYWEAELDRWAGLYGRERVVKTWTNRWAWMARACAAFANAIGNGDVSHSGDADYARHIGNAHRFELAMRNEEGRRMFVVTKERPESRNHIDLAVSGILSWQARLDALALGLGRQRKWTAA